MITAYAVLQNVRPNAAIAVLTEQATELGLTDFDMRILSAAADGYTIRIAAAVTRRNYQILKRACGVLNVRVETPPDGEEEEPETLSLLRKLAAQPAFNAAGKEGRFAREHRPAAPGEADNGAG